jgi:predicted NBD/HSP70 family sugar kinase
MKLPEVGEGLAFGVGASNYRTAVCDAEGNIENTFITPTPRTPEEFFAQTTRQTLNAAHDGARWAVLGVPGPVKVQSHPDGLVYQNFRVTNIPALHRREGFDPTEEMVKADPAILELLHDQEFNFLTVNDGDLAAQAAAHLYGRPNFDDEYYETIADLINGTGTGGALVRRDTRFPNDNLFHPDPGLWEIGHSPISLLFPSRTYERTVSGPAVSNHLGIPAEELTADDPVFEEVAHGIGRLVLDFGIYGGADLVVVSGGFAIGTQEYYKENLKRLLDRFANSHNPMADKVPDVKFVSPEMADTYELHGARGAILSHLTRRAIDQLVLKAD